MGSFNQPPLPKVAHGEEYKVVNDHPVLQAMATAALGERKRICDLIFLSIAPAEAERLVNVIDPKAERFGARE